MTLQLVGLQVLMVALLIGGAFFFLLQSISRDLEADNRSDLDHQFSLMRAWFEDPTVKSSVVMEPISAPVGGPEASQLFLLRIVDSNGADLLSASNPSTPPVSAFPPPGGESVRWHVPGGPHYLVNSCWINLHSTRERVQLQMAFDVTDDFTLIRRFRQTLTLVFGFLLLTSAGLSLLITRRALRPLSTLTESAARVQASQLSVRLNETIWPPELVPLVGEFDAMLVRLDDSFHRLARFSSDLSHELRTPINNLRGEAEVSLTRPRSAEEYRAVLESSLEEYARITRLIDTLLFIAKADQPEHELTFQELDAAAECQAVLDFFEAAGAEREITLLVRGQAKIYCEPMLFRRAMSNLVDNALRHTLPGGHIDLTVRSGLNSGTEVEVSDSGSGIAPEHLPRIFERFYQATKPGADSSEPISGFGLGLAIVRSIMELHGGQVTVSDTSHRGTTMSLFFPGRGEVAP